MIMLALVAGATAILGQPADDDIVVVARRIGQVSLTLGRDAQGRTTCGLDRSSGDGRIDRAVCKRAARCLGRVAVPQATVDTCIARQKDALLAAWKRGQRT